MRQLKSNSFEFYEPDQIGFKLQRYPHVKCCILDHIVGDNKHANVVEHLISITRDGITKAGGETWCCAWAPDGSYFAWSSGHRNLHLIPWDNEKLRRHNPSDNEGLNGRKYHLIDCGENIWSLAFGSGFSQKGVPSNQYRHCRFDQSLILATGLASGRIKLWNCQTGLLMIELLDHRDTVRCLDFTKDGSLQLVSASRDGSLKLWDLHNEGNMYSTFKASPTMFYGCRFSPNCRFIAAVGSCKTVYLWSCIKLTSLPHRLDGHCNEVASCDFSPDSALLATASYDTKIIIWDTYKQTKLRSLGHLHPSPRLIFAGGANDHYVRSISFCKDGLTLASVCDDGFVRFWNVVMPGDPLAISTVHEALSCQFSPDKSVLSVGFRNGDVKFLKATSNIPSLLQLCRKVIRKSAVTGHVDVLPLPKMLIGYLCYQDLVPDPMNC
ncbi:WD repeat and SOCS box-containing protein 1 [Bulinus truncatus]|nr:WD repeat and SOCS box-containing protein 1 [Bulinus truncatus]